MRRFVWPGYALALAASLFLSLKTVLGGCGVDSDSILAMTLWQGVRAHGLGWLGQFSFTPDNWLLSIVSFNFLSFALFGLHAWLVLASGWAVFALAALVSALLAHELGARRWALLLPFPLLLLGWYAQNPGYAAYPVSHNVTNLYGLAALLFALRAVRANARISYVLVFLLLVAGSVSDPWMVAAYDLPLLLSCGAVVWWQFRPAPAMWRLAAIALAAILLVRTHMLWTMRFLPTQSVRPGSPHVMAGNAAYLVKDLGGLFNIVPGGHVTDVLPALLSLAGAGLAGFTAWRAARPAGLPRLFLAVAGLSSLATMAGFVCLNVTQGDYSGRFLINILYFYAIFMAVAVARGWPRLGWRGKIVIGLFTGLFMGCGLATTAPVWRAPGFTIQTNGVDGIIGFLRANGLSYGYGPYHGANTNAVTALSDGRVTIRPVEFDPETGRMLPRVRTQSGASWLTVRDIPAGQREFFVYIVSDGEECASPALCVAGLTAQLGPPARALRNGQAIILVWDHKLFIGQ